MCNASSFFGGPHTRQSVKALPLRVLHIVTSGFPFVSFLVRLECPVSPWQLLQPSSSVLVLRGLLFPVFFQSGPSSSADDWSVGEQESLAGAVHFIKMVGSQAVGKHS